MLTTFSNARNFTAVGDTQPADVDKVRAAALTSLGVLIPGEVVALATAISGALSKKTDLADGTSTWLHLRDARICMVILAVVMIPALFRIGAGAWWHNGIRGITLLLLTLVSFAGWLALQPLSVYQG